MHGFTQILSVSVYLTKRSVFISISSDLYLNLSKEKSMICIQTAHSKRKKGEKSNF